MQSRRSKRQIHGLNADGMVACNPRDREAAHRARMHGIASEEPNAVTCGNCLTAVHRERRDQKKR